MKDLIELKTTEEIAVSILAEIAKARNELRCAAGDVEKAQSRLTFAIRAVNVIIDRKDER